MLKHLERTGNSTYRVRNFNSAIDCEFMYLYKLKKKWMGCLL